MKKKFKLEISKPCDADLNSMQKTTTGFFCSSCVKNVIDLSTKTNSEVAQFIAKNKNNTSICARLKTTQLEEEFEYNEIDKTKSLKYAVAIAASVLLTTNVVGQEKTIQNTEQNQPIDSDLIVGKMIKVVPEVRIISFEIKGRLLDSVTNKPISEKLFHRLKIQIEGKSNYYKVNSKTGEFSIPVQLDVNTKEIYFNVINDNYSLTKKVIIDIKNQTNKVYKQDLIVNPKVDFERIFYAGGIGINYINNKNTISNS
jgi:hypothetical protein